MNFKANPRPEGIVMPPLLAIGAGAERLPRLRMHTKTIVVVKMILILLTAALCATAHEGNSQSVTLTAKNASAETIISAVKQQTRFVFIYDKQILKDARKINVTVKNMPVAEFLNLAFKDQPFTWSVENQTVVLEKAAPQKGSALQNVTIAIAPLPVDVRGTVTNEKGEPVPGVTVSVRGTSIATSTNERGEYILKQVSEEATLFFSGANIENREVKLNGRKDLSITVRMKVSGMEEVVITGYSSRKLSEVTGALQKMNGEELRSGFTNTNAQSMLKGKMAGVYITEGGGGSVSNRGQIIMRGQASLPDAGNTNFGPLIVLDGVITTATSLQDIVNPNDIESITLLKDAASTAIYGSRAAQGVLVVTTRRGQAGKVNVGLNLKYGQTKDDRLVSLMNTSELTSHITKNMQAMYANTASIRNQFPTFQDFYNTTRPFTDADLNRDYAWDKLLYTDGHLSDINLSLSAGTEKSKFYGALDWYKEDGTLLDDRLDRRSIRLNFDQQITSKLSVSFNTNAIIDKYTSSTSENQFYLFQPWILPTYANGQLADSIPFTPFRATSAPLKQWKDNPAFSHSYNTAIRKIHSYLGSGIIKYKIFPWLTAQSTNTLQSITNNNNSYKDPRTYRGRFDGALSSPVYMNGSLVLTDTKMEYFLTSNQLSFQRNFGEHAIQGLAGQEYSRTHFESAAINVYNTPYPGERNVAAFLRYGSYIDVLRGSTPTPSQGAATVDKASFSLFGEGNYSYRQTYFASASVRRDASTNFGKQERYATFYSLSGAWLVSNEQFMRTVRPVTNLKLRAAYGTSGREAGADFLNFTVYQDNVQYENSSNFGSTVQRLANNEITWETTYSTNAGVDLELWKRINLTVDWYSRRSKGLIQNALLPSYIGFPSQTRNIGELKNTGVEIMLSSLNIKSGGFSWSTDFNISFNKNKLVKLYGDSLIDGWTGSYYRYVGEDLNVLKAIKYAGVNPDNGRPLFERVMPDGKIQLVDSLPLILADGTRSFRSVGSATPKFYGGITNTFRYKGFTLSVLLNFVYGAKIMNSSLVNFLSPTIWQSGYTMVKPDGSIRFWQGPGDTKANFPNYYDPTFTQRGTIGYNSSLIFQDASYIRMRNVRLGYDIPKEWLRYAKLHAVNVYLSADNLFLIKSDELFASDPEGSRIGNNNGSYTGSGFTSSQPRRFLIGINVNF